MERESDIECDDDCLTIMEDETDCSQIMEYRPNSKTEEKSTALKTESALYHYQNITYWIMPSMSGTDQNMWPSEQKKPAWNLSSSTNGLLNGILNLALWVPPVFSTQVRPTWYFE